MRSFLSVCTEWVTCLPLSPPGSAPGPRGLHCMLCIFGLVQFPSPLFQVWCVAHHEHMHAHRHTHSCCLCPGFDQANLIMCGKPEAPVVRLLSQACCFADVHSPLCCFRATDLTLAILAQSGLSLTLALGLALAANVSIVRTFIPDC